jgi:hypothetical protein
LTTYSTPSRTHIHSKYSGVKLESTEMIKAWKIWDNISKNNSYKRSRPFWKQHEDVKSSPDWISQLFFRGPPTGRQLSLHISQLPSCVTYLQLLKIAQHMKFLFISHVSKWSHYFFHRRFLPLIVSVYFRRICLFSFWWSCEIYKIFSILLQFPAPLYQTTRCLIEEMLTSFSGSPNNYSRSGQREINRKRQFWSKREKLP